MIEKLSDCEDREVPAGARDEHGERITDAARENLEQRGLHLDTATGRVHDAHHAVVEPSSGTRVPPAHVAAETTEAEALKVHRTLGSGQFAPRPHPAADNGHTVQHADTGSGSLMASALRAAYIRQGHQRQPVSTPRAPASPVCGRAPGE